AAASRGVSDRQERSDRVRRLRVLGTLHGKRTVPANLSSAGNLHGIPAAEIRECGAAARRHARPGSGPEAGHSGAAANDRGAARPGLPAESVRRTGPGEGSAAAMNPLSGTGAALDGKDPLASLALRLPDTQDRECYAALV